MDRDEWRGLSPDERLLVRFQSINLSALDREDLFGEWTQAIHVCKATPMPARGDLNRLVTSSTLARFVEPLEGDLGKFVFGEVNLAEWQRRYAIPRTSTIQAFCQRGSHGRCHANQIVNRSPEAIERWVTSDLIPTIQLGTDRINVLIGGVGSGKSTLNKLVTSVYFPLFKAERIVVSRIEYRKLDKYIRTQHVHRANADAAHQRTLLSAIERGVYCAILRDIFSYGWSRPREMRSRDDARITFDALPDGSWPELDVTKPEVQRRLRDFIDDRYGPDKDLARNGIDPAATIKEVLRAIKAFSAPHQRGRGRWYKEILGDLDRQAALEPFAQYAVEQAELKLFVIFDGLDWVQIADFIGYTRHRDNLQAIAEWLIDGRRAVSLPRVKEYLYPTFQVTMRPNTYELFWRDYSQALLDTQGPIYYVAPVEMRDIVASIAAGPLFRAVDGAVAVPREEVLGFFSDVQTRLCRILGLRTRELSDLFMQNVRYRVHFARDVLEELFRPALAAIDAGKADNSHESLVEGLRAERRDLLERKDYRLIDMLLYAKNDRFANFVRIEGDEIDLDRHSADPAYLQTILTDNNIKSGYIGNVFNYHIPYSTFEDMEYLLEKVRILDLLIDSDKEPLGVRELQRKFAHRGWRVSPYFDFSVAILIRENMIAGYHIEAGASGYVATAFGRTVRRHLVGNMIYLENVFFGTFLPRGIKRMSKDIYRNAVQRHEWVAASIYHCWLFLRLIRTAEGGRASAFFEEVRHSVVGSIERIINAKSADPRIAAYALRHIMDFERVVDE